MSTSKKIHFRHRVYHQFVVSVALIFIVMIAIIVLFTYYLLSRASVDASVLNELILDEIMVGLAVSGVAILVIVMRVRQIINPVEALSRALHQLAEGNYDAVIDYQSDNELGQLVREFDLLRDVLYKQYIEKQKNSPANIFRLTKADTKADIYVDSELPYKTMVKEVLNNGKIVILQPFRQGKTMDCVKGNKFKMYFYPVGNRYSVIVEVEDISVIDGDTLIVLNPLSEPICEQRRKAYRVDVECEADIQRFDIWDEHVGGMKTLNISAEGAWLHVNEEYDEGEKVFLQLLLPFPGQAHETAMLTAEVVRKSEDTDSENKCVGVRFIGDLPNVHRLMARFIVSNQQELVKQRLLTA